MRSNNVLILVKQKDKFKIIPLDGTRRRRQKEPTSNAEAKVALAGEPRDFDFGSNSLKTFTWAFGVIDRSRPQQSWSERGRSSSRRLNCSRRKETSLRGRGRGGPSASRRRRPNSVCRSRHPTRKKFPAEPTYACASVDRFLQRCRKAAWPWTDGERVVVHLEAANCFFDFLE